MAEKNSLWRNIRKKAEQNRRTGAKPKKPTAEMLRQERKIKAKQYPNGGPVGDDGLYNMQRALELGYTPDETGHWPSVDSETGMWLKSKEHPTAWMEYMHGYALNPEVQKQYQHPVVNPEGYFGENQLQYNLKADGGYLYAEGGQYLTVDGEYHRVYRNADGDIAVNHPKEDKGKWDTINLTDKSGANTIAEGVASVRKWHRENPSYAQGGKLYPDGGGINPGKQKAVASTTDVSVRALPEGLFEQVKANPPARQPQTISVVDKRKQNPITKKPINPNRDLVGGKFEDTIPIEIIKSSYKHGVDPATALSIGLLESRMGTTDPNVGHIMVDSYSDYMPGAEDMVLTIKEKQDYAKKLGYTDPLLQLQAYNGLGVLSNKRGEIGKSAYGLPIPKEGIDLRQNPLYGKKVKNVRDSVIMQSPDLVRLMNYYKPKMDGGYMYYAGGPMEYKVGGKVWKHIGAGAYALGEGILDTVTMGATDQLTDKGFEWLTKVGNKNIDLSNPDDVKFLKTQQQIKGYSNAAGAIGTAVVTGNVQGAISQGTKGLNTAFQASDWASDDFKKWSQGISGVAGMAAGFAGGLNSDSFNAAAKAGTGVAGFGQKAGKIGSFGNQVTGMFGSNQQPLWQQGEARQEYLNSPEYLAMKERENQAYVNQGLSFASTGGNINNSLNLQNSMRGKYNNYKRRYSKGGTFQKFGINEIPDSAGYHHENAYGGVPIGPNAMAEGGEFVLDNNYVVSDEVDGMNTQTDEFGRTMAQNLKRDLSKYTVRDLNSKNRDSLRRPMDPLAEQTINQIKQKAMIETEMARAEAQAKEQERQAMVDGALQYAAAGGKLNDDITKIVKEEYAAAYGGYINPKKYKGLNMPYSSGGKLPKEVLRARVESHMSPEKADAYVENYAKGGGIHIKESKKGTFTAAAKKRGKSVQEFARQVLANKGNYSAAMVKKANFARNAAKWHHAEGGDIRPNNPGFNALPEYVQAKIMNNMAHGGPVVSNVPQDFDLYAQNRGGMMMARGGNMYAVGGPPYDLPGMADMTASEYNDIINYLNNLNTPNYVDNQGNTSSILSRRNKNKSTLVQPIGRMQSRNLQQLPTDNTVPGIIGTVQQMPGLSDYASTSLGEFSDQFTPEDVQYSSYLDKNKPAPMTGPVVSEDVKLTPEETAALQYQQKYSQPGQFTADLIDNQSNKTGLTNLYKNTPTTIVQPSQSDVTPTVFPQTGTSSTQTKQSNQPNEGLTGLDYASMGMQALGPLSQLYYGLKGPDDVNYERITVDKIDPYRAITLANEESRRAQDTAGYNLRQNAPTSGSYMANMRALGLGAGKQRAAQTAATQYQADVANTQMQNQVNAQNAQIAMQEQIDRQQERDAARTNVTEGLSGVGSSTANMIRDYRTNQINQMIAKNIGTNNYKYDPINQTITYQDQNGKVVTVPAQTVVGTNPVNIATGQMQQPKASDQSSTTTPKSNAPVVPYSGPMANYLSKNKLPDWKGYHFPDPFPVTGLDLNTGNYVENNLDVKNLDKTDTEGIKAFQDWMDEFYPNWLNNGKSLKKGKGYGNFGDQTENAWNIYGNTFLGAAPNKYQPPVNTLYDDSTYGLGYLFENI